MVLYSDFCSTVTNGSIANLPGVTLRIATNLYGTWICLACGGASHITIATLVTIAAVRVFFCESLPS